MKTSRHTEAQIIAILRYAEGGVSVAELCREHGVSSASFYKWRSKYGGAAESRSAILSRLATIPVVCCKGSLNSNLMVRQNWIAASENSSGRQGLPSCGASHIMSLSSQINSDTRLRIAEV